MRQTKIIARAVKGYTVAVRTAKVLRIAHGAALGCAAASLAVGGTRVVQKLAARYRGQ
ncbi:MAG: hypothetical protein LBB50_06590 [Oscillospiraceae bacterium]|jgi:hypothetical protein|nr:hypothetical protein [Oscillospiraceae bacterium]